MRKRKVALLLHQLRYGGAERALTYLAKGFAEQGIEVDFLIRNQEHTAYLDNLPEEVRLLRVGKKSVLKTRVQIARSLPQAVSRTPRLFYGKDLLPINLRMIPGIVTYLKAEQPDGLLTTIPRNNISAIWAQKIARVPTRVVIREANTFSAASATAGHYFERNMHHLAARWYPEAAGIVSVCDGVGDDLADFLKLERSQIRTIYNPLDLQRIERLSAESSRHPWLQDKTHPVLVTVGRLHPQKDHETLLKALARMNDQRPVRLIIVGEGDRDKLLHQARQLGVQDRISLAGNTANPYAYIARADAFVLSSAWEGFPNVLLEALACRTPIVSTDCPSGGPSELLHRGRYGRMVPVGNPECMAEAIEGALQAPGDLEAGYRYVESFTMERSAGSYLSLLLGERADAL